MKTAIQSVQRGGKGHSPRGAELGGRLLAVLVAPPQGDGRRVVLVGFDKERYGEGIGFAFSLDPPARRPAMRDILESEADSKSGCRL